MATIPELIEYLNADPKRAAKLAKTCKTSVAYLRLVGHGYDNRKPGTELTKTIERETGISRRTLRPDWFE